MRNDEKLCQSFKKKSASEGGYGSRIRIPLYEHQYNLHIFASLSKITYPFQPLIH